MTKPRFRTFCRIGVFAFAALYAIALTAFFAGTFGIWGAERDPLAGIFLIPLGLPWNLLTSVVPDAFLPWFAALAPALNLGLIWSMCKRLKD